MPSRAAGSTGYTSKNFSCVPMGLDSLLTRMNSACSSTMLTVSRTQIIGIGPGPAVVLQIKLGTTGHAAYVKHAVGTSYILETRTLGFVVVLLGVSTCNLPLTLFGLCPALTFALSHHILWYLFIIGILALDFVWVKPWCDGLDVRYWFIRGQNLLDSVHAQQSKFLESLSVTMSEMVQSNIEERLRKINLPTTSSLPNQAQSQSYFNLDFNRTESISQQSLDQLLGLGATSLGNLQDPAIP
uniref:Uncharacterized protein n=1 Tax=Glossina austeni TaxID=7395 RepID=A0A1A9VII8_GLOAU